MGSSATGLWAGKELGVPSLRLLLLPSKSFPEILEAELGASPGDREDDVDLDYEILDKAGEQTPP